MDMIIVAVALIVALGSFTQGLTGFGSALVSVPLLSMVVDAKLAVPIAGVFGWLVTLPIVWKMRHHIQYKAGLLMVAGAIPASFIGAKLLMILPSNVILISMGIILIVASLHSMRATQPLFQHVSAPITIGAGFASGVLGASVGEAGPPVIAYTSMQSWNSDQSKSTLAFFFMLQMIGAIISFWHVGLLTTEVTKYVSYSMPTFIIGLIAGMTAYHYLKKYKIDYHHIVHSLLLVIGCVLVIKNVI